MWSSKMEDFSCLCCSSSWKKTGVARSLFLEPVLLHLSYTWCKKFPDHRPSSKESDQCFSNPNELATRKELPDHRSSNRCSSTCHACDARRRSFQITVPPQRSSTGAPLLEWQSNRMRFIWVVRLRSCLVQKLRARELLSTEYCCSIPHMAQGVVWIPLLKTLLKKGTFPKKLST